MKIEKREMKTERRGRPAKQKQVVEFNPEAVKLFRGNDLQFNESLFIPLKTNTEIDIILSTEGGLMPGTSMMIAGGPGSGKSTLVMDMLSKLNIKVGFHAHNNLGCAVANSLTAAESGAELIDACIRGFGAGAGNAPLEMLIPVFEQSGYSLGINFEETIKEADRVMDYLVPNHPISTPINILTGLKRLFSGFEKPIVKASKLYGIEYSSLIFELGNRKLVAGQEDLILEVPVVPEVPKLIPFS